MEKFVDCRVQTFEGAVTNLTEVCENAWATQLLSSGSAQAYCAHAGDERHAARSLERPHGPPTEDGDYAAGALGVHWLRPQCLRPTPFRPRIRCAPSVQGCATGEKLKCAQQHYKPPQVQEPIT